MSFKVKQNGKVYSLKTKVKVKGYPYISKAFKAIKVNGKNVLGKFKKAKSNVIYMKLAGKKVNLSYSLNKGYKKSRIDITRDYFNNIISRNAKLKKGDVITFNFYKAGWAKDEQVMIVVK